MFKAVFCDTNLSTRLILNMSALVIFLYDALILC